MGIAMLFGLLAVVLGTATEFLLYARTPGLNWSLYVVTMAASIFIVARRFERPLAPWVLGLWGAALTAAGAMARFDGYVVQTVGPFFCVGLLTLASWWTFAGDVALEAFGWPLPLGLWGDVLLSPGQIGPGMQGLGSATPSNDTARRVLLGVLAALPLLAVFGLLFALSDDVFRQMLWRIQQRVSEDAAWATLRLVVCSLLALGLLRQFALRERPSMVIGGDGPTADALVISVALGLLNLLFAAFLLVQSHYLFGGEKVVALPGVTYAEYARRGFFELVVATAMVLGVVATVHYMLQSSTEKRAAVWLSALLMLLTTGVAASAMKRLSLYMAAYGLTLTRCYAAAAMGVICALLGLALVAAMRGKSGRWLMARMMYATLLGTSMLGLVDVEGLIARSNVMHAHAFDMTYLQSLSADVVPVLDEAAASTDPTTRTRAQDALNAWIDAHSARDDEGWPSYNVARARAATAALPRRSTP